MILACRHLDKANKTKEEIIKETFNKNVHVKILDLASMKSIREFAENVKTGKRNKEILKDDHFLHWNIS